jgi:hypothetical protein
VGGGGRLGNGSGEVNHVHARETSDHPPRNCALPQGPAFIQANHFGGLGKTPHRPNHHRLHRVRPTGKNLVPASRFDAP